MEKVLVTVGITDNNYSAYLAFKDNVVVATEKTFEKLKKEMESALEFHLDGMREDGEVIPEVFTGEYELVYKFDTQSLLSHYKGIFTNSALSRLTGINDRQLQRYASGETVPREEQARKISDALHSLGKELLVVEL